MNCIICKKDHRALHYHTPFHYLLKWMTEAREDKRPFYKKIFWWKSYIMPTIITGFCIILLMVIR